MIPIGNKKNRFMFYRSNRARLLCVLLGLVVLLSGLTTGSQAWYATENNINIFSGTTLDIDVRLLKFEKLADGTETDVPVSKALFYLFRVNDDATHTQIAGPFETNALGQIQLEDLPPGSYYFLEADASYGYTFDTTASGDSVTTYPFVVEAQDEGDTVVVTAYNRRQLADLRVTKTVVNAGGRAISDEQKALAFTFTVVFGDGGTYPYAVDGGTQQPVASGGTFTLKHGETAVFYGLPVGTTYVVTETPVADYSVGSTGHAGTVTPNGAAAAFTNTCLLGVGTLRIGKTVVAEEINPDIEFMFTITFDALTQPVFYSVNGGTPQAFTSGGTITLKHGETAVFENMPAGVRYKVVETAGPGYIAAALSYDGVILAGSDVLLPFVNHAQPGEEETTLEIGKIVEGGDAGDKLFRFTVTIGEPGEAYTYTINGGLDQTLISGEAIELKHGETAVFPHLPAGTTYTVVEDDYTADGYDTAVSAVSGAAIDTITHVRFVNTKRAEPPQDGVLVVKKVVEGDVPDALADQAFTFVVTIDGTEAATFSLRGGEESAPILLPYGSTYEVREADAYPDGFVSSILNGYGTGTGQTIEVVQTNTYTYIAPLVTQGPRVHKEITGDEPAADATFTFTLTASGGAPMPNGAVNGVATVQATGATSAQFGDITYTSAGVYIYTVAETAGYTLGYTYDTAVYTLTVTVIEQDGKLVVESAVYTKAGSDDVYEQAVFTNVYDATVPPEEKVTVSGSKTWDHGSCPAGQQLGSITVYVKHGDVVVEQKVITAADNWAWSFTLPKHDANGNEIIYTIDEADVANYSKTISGYNITNTYIQTQPSPRPGETVGTGDDGGMTLWLALLACSGAGALVPLYRYGRKRLRKSRVEGN